MRCPWYNSCRTAGSSSLLPCWAGKSLQTESVPLRPLSPVHRPTSPVSAKSCRWQVFAGVWNRAVRWSVPYALGMTAVIPGRPPQGPQSPSESARWPQAIPPPACGWWVSAPFGPGKAERPGEPGRSCFAYLICKFVQICFQLVQAHAYRLRQSLLQNSPLLD